MKILIAGDYCPQERIKDKLENSDFSFLDDIRNLTVNQDFSIVNLECPIIKGHEIPIEKNGPNLATSEIIIDSLKYGGFNIVTTANNHILDYGEGGLYNTLSQLNSSDILHVGSGCNIEDSGKPLIVKKGDYKVAFINCCENEFSLATTNTGGANHIDVISITRQIIQLKGLVDKIVIITHGGHELCQLPPLEMKRRNRFFIEMGADAVINHHQHVYSGYEIYLDKPIFYGLGNFCFDRHGEKNTSWNLGYIVCLDFGENSENSFKIIPYNQCSEEAKVKLLPPESFTKELYMINEIIKEDSLLIEKLNSYYQKQQLQIEASLQPFSNKVISYLTYKRYIPLLLKKKTLLRLQNWIFCESHRAKLNYYFSRK